MDFVTFSAQETFNLGVSFSKRLSGGDIILLDGDLGAGKTVFTKGVAAGLGIDESVVSPTFTIMNEYSGRLKLFHYDAYRLSCGEEAVFAGLAEYLGDKSGVCVIEWYSNILDILQNFKTIMVKINYKGENSREITINDE